MTVAKADRRKKVSVTDSMSYLINLAMQACQSRDKSIGLVRKDHAFLFFSRRCENFTQFCLYLVYLKYFLCVPRKHQQPTYTEK